MDVREVERGWQITVQYKSTFTEGELFDVPAILERLRGMGP